MRADPDLPALTEAEARFVDSYLAVVDQLARLNPAHDGDRRTRRLLLPAHAPNDDH